MSSNTSGYIALSFVGGIMLSIILAGAYYASGNNIGSPTGMSVYDTNYRYTGGKKTRRKNKKTHGKTKRT